MPKDLTTWKSKDYLSEEPNHTWMASSLPFIPRVPVPPCTHTIHSEIGNDMKMGTEWAICTMHSVLARTVQGGRGWQSLLCVTRQLLDCITLGPTRSDLAWNPAALGAAFPLTPGLGALQPRPATSGEKAPLSFLLLGIVDSHVVIENDKQERATRPACWRRWRAARP